MKVTLNRQMMIPTVKFAPIRIDVSIEDEVSRENLREDYQELSKKLDSIIALEILSTLEEQDTIIKIGYESYLKGLQSERENIKNNL
ncbi:MAG: hypothetical protein ACOC1K_01515 [Nanoarchaeota archaeon]